MRRYYNKIYDNYISVFQSNEEEEKFIEELMNEDLSIEEQLMRQKSSSPIKTEKDENEFVYEYVDILPEQYNELTLIHYLHKKAIDGIVDCMLDKFIEKITCVYFAIHRHIDINEKKMYHLLYTYDLKKEVLQCFFIGNKFIPKNEHCYKYHYYLRLNDEYIMEWVEGNYSNLSLMKYVYFENDVIKEYEKRFNFAYMPMSPLARNSWTISHELTK